MSPIIFSSIEILSLQHFNLSYPHISWNVKLWGDQNNLKQKVGERLNFSAGIGASYLGSRWQAYILTNLKINKDFESGQGFIGPHIRLGFKKELTKNTLLTFISENEKLGSQINSKLSSHVHFGVNKFSRISFGGESLIDKNGSDIIFNSSLTFYF